MKKRLIYVFVILVLVLFVISACEPYSVGRKLNKELTYNPIKSYVDIKGGENINNIHISKDGTVYYKSIPIFSSTRKENNRNKNSQKNIITGNVVYRWRSANTNQGIYSAIERRRGNELISIIQNQGDVYEDIPLIRDNRVIYNGREFIFEVSGFSESVLSQIPELERASTMRYKTYYLNDLMPVLRLEDENGDRRVINYIDERLSELGNDMNYSYRMVIFGKWIPDWDRPNEEEFAKYFIQYIQFFDENGESINEIPKGLVIDTISERFFRDNLEPLIAVGTASLTGSEEEGDTLILYEDGVEWGDFIDDGEGGIRYHLPMFEGISRIRGGGTPARRLER